MAALQLRTRRYWFAAIVSLVLIVDTLSVRLTASAEQDPVLLYAVLFDFMLVMPLLYWLLVLRPKGKSIAKIAPLPIIGAAAAWIALPPSLRGAVWQAAWPVEAAVVAMEAFVIGYEIRIVYRFIRRFRLVRKQQPDTGEALRIAVHEGIGQSKLARLLLHDLSMAYYLIFSWGRSRPAPDAASTEARRFTYHRKTNQTLYAAIITKIVVLEGVAMHFLVQQWSHWAAWILTALDAWLLAMLWADNRASRLQPIRLQAGRLTLRYGLRIQADVPLDAIADIAHAGEYRPEEKELRESATPMLSTPNVRIALAYPVEIEGLLFLPRKVTRIYLSLDDPAAFVRETRAALDRRR